MERELLGSIVTLHAQWLRTSGQCGRQADLENADLRQADLRGVDLSFATLAGANLERAEMAGSRFAGAVLSRTSMQYACLSGADLSQADLSQSDATGADFTGANLTDSVLADTRLEFACLRDADLTEADLRGATLAYGDLSNAVLGAATPLPEMNLWHVNITNTRFGGSRHALALATGTKPFSPQLPFEVRLARLTQNAALIWLSLGLLALLLGFGMNVYQAVVNTSLSMVTPFNYFVPLFMIVTGAPVLIGAAWVGRRARWRMRHRRRPD